MVSIVMGITMPREVFSVTLGLNGFVVNIMLMDSTSSQRRETALLYNNSDLVKSLRFRILSLDHRDLLNCLRSFPLILHFQK